MTTEEIIQKLDFHLESCRAALVNAEAAIRSVDDLRAEIARLEAAKKALTAPQSPAGRKRIGDARRKRKKAEGPQSSLLVTAPDSDLPVFKGDVA
jgi:hypothetical protein